MADGWFGPLGDGMADRIGDVIAVPHADLAIVASEREFWLNRMVGMHGSSSRPSSSCRCSPRPAPDTPADVR